MTSPTLASPRRTRTSWEIQRAVLFALIVRELRTRVGPRWIGIVWTLVEPLIQVLLMVAVFGSARSMGSPNMDFPVFLVSGMLPFFLFRSLAQRLTEAIDTNRALFSYRQVKPIDTVVARGLFEGVLWLNVLVMSIVCLLWLDMDALPQQPLELCGIILIAAGLGFGLGLLMAVVTHELPRVRSLVRMAYFPLYFCSGVLFSVSNIPQPYQGWLLWNPLLHVVELARNAFSPAHALLPGVEVAYPASLALVLVALALALYRRDRQKLLLGG